MQSAAGAIVATENLTKDFGRRRAVDGVTISVGAGEALALYGPNGAGKTTLLRMLGGLLRPTSGKARIGDANLPAGPEVRRSIGVISHYSLLYDALTARENVEFAARLYHVPDFRAQAMHSLEQMKIADRADTPVRALSRGMRQRVSVARAIVHKPAVVLADEPFTGLDVVGARALSELLVDLRRAGAVLILVTHNVEEGLSLATHAAVMNRGRVQRFKRRSEIDAATFAKEYQEIVTSG
jgi:heme exporter protein A